MLFEIHDSVWMVEGGLGFRRKQFRESELKFSLDRSSMFIKQCTNVNISHFRTARYAVCIIARVLPFQDDPASNFVDLRINYPVNLQPSLKILWTTIRRQFT